MPNRKMKMQIFTSRYSNNSIAQMDVIPVGISLYPPRWKTPYKVQGYIKELAPTRDMFGLPFEEYKPKYLAILESLGVEKITQLIQASVPAHSETNKVVLLCFEDLRKQDKWCHRRLFAEWWREKTGETICEMQ